MGYSMQLNQKTREGAQHRNRDQQFRYINRQVASFRKRGDPVLSVDGKKKECASSEGWRAQWETVPPGKKSEPRSLDSREEGDRISEAYRQSHLLDGEQVTGP
jgi:hypothetical protein